MIWLCLIERLQGHNFRHDRTREDFRAVELSDVGFGDALLFVAAVEDRRSLLRAFVWALSVELRGIVRHREEDAVQFSVGDLLGILYNLPGLGVSGLSVADSLHMLEDGLDTPEASAGEDGGLLRRN